MRLYIEWTVKWNLYVKRIKGILKCAYRIQARKTGWEIGFGM